jgi:hypothetical protein
VRRRFELKRRAAPNGPPPRRRRRAVLALSTHPAEACPTCRSPIQTFEVGQYDATYETPIGEAERLKPHVHELVTRLKHGDDGVQVSTIEDGVAHQDRRASPRR